MLVLLHAEENCLVNKVLDQRPEALSPVPNSSLDMLHDLEIVCVSSLHSLNLSPVFILYLFFHAVYLLDWALFCFSVMQIRSKNF